MAKSQRPTQDLAEILNELWLLDTNRLRPGTDYIISLQGRAGYVAQGSHYARDKAKAPLFTYVNEDKLRSIDTYDHFIKLLDNYEMSTGVSETVTSEELQENELFLDSILETDVMKQEVSPIQALKLIWPELIYGYRSVGEWMTVYDSGRNASPSQCTHKYLVRKGQSPSDQAQFKRQLYDIWFRLYHRDRRGGEDSCGFEHVFVGETKFGQEIMGLHNWVQFYLQEKHGHVDYKGYKARDNKDTPDEDDHVLNLQFSWKGLVKPVGGSFIGVSPEFEVALFTIIFLMSTEKMTSVLVKVDEYMLELVVYRHGRSIGTSFPKLLSSNNRDL